MASRPLNLGPDQPEGWSWTACTAVAHQTATESSPFASPISVIGGHLAGGRGAMLKGGRGQTGEQHGCDEEIEANGDPIELERLYSI